MAHRKVTVGSTQLIHSISPWDNPAQPQSGLVSGSNRPMGDAKAALAKTPPIVGKTAGGIQEIKPGARGKGSIERDYKKGK